VYEATEWAHDAGPLLCQIGRWAARSPKHNGGFRVSPVAIMLSMRTNFDSSKADGIAGTFAFRFGDNRYIADIRDGRIDVRAGETGSADVTITCDPDELKLVLYGGAPVESLRVEGDMGLARQLPSLFSLPPKVEPAPAA
jgi:putative sterol carrier protein